MAWSMLTITKAPITSDRVLLTMPDPRLHQRSQPVRADGEQLSGLLRAMSLALDHSGGLGLASVQLGQLVAVAIARIDGRDLILVNPRLLASRGSVGGWEGCLSVPDRIAWVMRPERLTVEAFDARGHVHRHKASGLAARIIAHELDHLAGRLYLDDLPADRIIDTRLHPTPPAPPT